MINILNFRHGGGGGGGGGGSSNIELYTVISEASGDSIELQGTIHVYTLGVGTLPLLHYRIISIQATYS